uniref:Switch-associated protein 70 n=1 Tax=Cajanus cajan TaxID=3821 RepID=A0A151RMW9_CAJCA|nr:Switch-associated protein 70 [Cajanus cajan]
MAANSGTKYVSVNLNKSYGQHSTPFGSNRAARPAAGAAAIPSRPRSSHKAGPKLSVPPPLNLPSLRKEHERFDSLGSGSGPSGSGGPGSGARPSSSGVGWTKPVAEDGLSRPVIQGKPAATAAAPVSSAVLRGEDFPSLRATLAPGPGPSQKIQESGNQNQSLNQKQKHSLGDENVFVEEKKEGSLITDHLSVSRSVNVVGGGDDGRGSRLVNPRIGGVLPHKHDKRGQLRGNEVGKVLSSEVESYDRMGPDGNSWRTSNVSFSKDAGNERNGVGVRPSSGSRDVGKDNNKYVLSPFRDDDSGKRDFGRRDSQGGKQQPWNNAMESYGFLEDFGGSGFDGRDLFSGCPVGVVKKKKDVLKQTDFHDPVRESFEAELERVQRMQEQERQRIIEEQERALELARREEEERLRQVREQEERQRRLEEEAREAAWRAEQERIESLRKAEEQRLAREEEKQRIFLEEERRKQAAKQKLLELEQKIARRQAEATKSGGNAPVVVDEKMTVTMNEKETSRVTDVGDWEDSERMVDRILTSASSDSSSVNRPLEMGSRSHFSRDLSSTLVDRGKPVNTWRRDAYENWSNTTFYPHDQENSHNSPRRDLSIGGKPFMRKEYNSGSGFVSSRTYYKGGISEPHLDEYGHVKPPQRWNQSADGDHLSRNTEIDSDFHENFFERFGDGWTQGRSRGNPFPPFPERTYPSSESDGPYALGRSRYSVRQPRVLPPPSLGSVHRTYKTENEHSSPSAFLENDMHYNQTTRSESTLPAGYDNGNRAQHEVVDVRQETTENEDRKVETTPRCDSQSSLSVSSPPSSPTHLSHDDLDDSGDSPTILTSEESKSCPLPALDNESIATPVVAGNVVAGNENVGTPCAVSSGDDDEWTTENNEQFQEQEEYDEDEDYHEEDEVHEGDENAQLNQDFEDLHLQEKGLPHLMDNLVLGFDEGVQVGMPNEEFERTSKDEETTFMAQQADITLEECVSYDNAQADEKALQPVDDTSQLNLNSSSCVFQESEKPAQDLVIQPSNSLSSVVSESLVNVEASNYHSTPSSVTIAPHYSSSSAIQIGSIQMPLHLHPQVGAPLSHMHPSQPPLFQFGQFRYTSPISQGIMPLGPQSMSYVQPNIPSSFSYNHGGHMSAQTGPETSDPFIKNEIRHHSVDSHPSNSRNLSSQGSLPSEDGRIEAAHDPNNSSRTSTIFQLDKQGNQSVVGKSSSSKETEVHSVTRDASLHSVSKDNFMESRTQFPASGGRGKRYVFTVKNSNSRSSGPATSRVNHSGGFMRRPRRNVQQRTETGPRKPMANKLGKQTVESAENSHGMDSGSRVEKVDGKDSTKTQTFSHYGQSNLKRNLCSEEDVDVPLQSGIIRVFEQPGIEAPSDEDDFIEVRSKRQMLNDRREQREKEIKAKSRVAKVQRRPRSASQSVVAVGNSSKGSIIAGEVASTLPPIGTPPLKIDAQADLRSQISRPSLQTSLPAVSGGEKDPGVIFESKNKVLDNVQTSLGSWGTAQISQQVMTLTQTQLDEAMKPQFDSQASVGNLSGAVKEPSLPTSSILTKEKTFNSAVNPINSLLAGEKIQFGAVTSPTVLPSSSRVSHGIGPPRSSRSDMQISHNLTGSENDCSLFFDKEKHSNESHGHLEDCDAEAEAEAAASAVAVAAISSDEIVGNGLGTCSVPASDGKSFVAADIDRVVAGAACEQQSAGQSRSEESLSVSLPADLSVETPPISLWPPIPSTQNSSGQMISHFPSVPPHFPSGPPSHFPFYEMNPMMGGPVFAFGPHDESASTTQSQSQKSTTTASRPIGSWQQCHSGVESFYGPPTGFTGPFIAPPGGIPGVQGPPHMVVYNHFAPVGQFGQVGLSFMGTTYIPSGKQPDWKHIPTSSAPGPGDGDMNGMNMTSSQRNPAPSTEMSVQARWPHVPNSQLSSIPLSMPLQQLEGLQTSQFSHGSSVDQPLNTKRFTGSRVSTSSDGDRNFPRAADMNVNQLPDELGLVDASNSTLAKTSAQDVINKTPTIPITDGVKVDVQNANGSNSNNQNASSSFKSQPSQVNNSTQQSDHSSGHTSNYQRGGGSQRNNSGGEWSHRRGYQGRNQSLGADKNYSSTKVKQIYVAKQTISGASSVS